MKWPAVPTRTGQDATLNFDAAGKRFDAVGAEITALEARFAALNYTVPPSLEHSWVTFGAPYGSLGYVKDKFGFVHLTGTLKSGEIGKQAFLLPGALAPGKRHDFGVLSNGALGTLIVESSGAVVPAVGSNLSFYLDGVHFLAGS